MNKFYDLKPILSKKAVYNVIIGERSSGKTYTTLKHAIENYIENGKQLMDFNNRCIIYLNKIKHGDDVTVNIQNYHKTLVTLKKIEEDGLKWRFRKYSF